DVATARAQGLRVAAGVDERRDLGRDLQAAHRALRQLETEVTSRLAEVAPAAVDEELVAALALTALLEGRERLLRSLESGAVRRELEASAGRRDEDGIPAFLWQLGDGEGGWARYGDDEADLLLELRRTWGAIRTYRGALPRLQQRGRPTLIEYASTWKDAIVQMSGAAKWLLHLLLGGLVFAAVRACLLWRGAGRRRSSRRAFAVVLAVALGVELADWIDGALTAKYVSPAGSLADAVMTCLLAAVFLLVELRSGRTAAPARPSSRE
ncbi:MAG: hypothetical protein D6696_15750, partial [Acidobacteria bacterium]